MKKFLAETLGTFVLVFMGTGAMILNQIYPEQVTHLGVSLAFGLSVSCMIFCIGKISGAHINPAVSLAFALEEKSGFKSPLLFMTAQVLGAILASAFLRFLFPNSNTLGETLPKAGIFNSFLIEFLISFLLMFLIFSVAKGAKEKGLSAAWAIGAYVFLAAFVTGPLTGASMNPARSIGPALISGNLSTLWIYILATSLGTVSSIPLYKFLYKDIQ